MSPTLQTPQEALRGAISKIDAELGIGSACPKESVVLPGGKILHIVIHLKPEEAGGHKQALIRADLDTEDVMFQ